MSSLSVIVPVLNEAALVGEFLRRVRALDPGLEIIVVDGGSSDGTETIARPFADQVIAAPPGRASQMNAGAAQARGEILWFLHADCEAPREAVAEIEALLSESPYVGGCFRLRYPRLEPVYRVSDSLGNFGVDLFGFALGDHGIFCRRAVFEKIGGYPIVPILEDAELYCRLRRRGRMRQLRPRIISSPRTFERNGRYRTTLTYFLILFLYVCGARIEFLNRIYRRFRRGPSADPAMQSLATPGALRSRS